MFNDNLLWIFLKFVIPDTSVRHESIRGDDHRADIVFRHTGAILWVYVVQCKRDKITQIQPCLPTVALGTTRITQKYTLSIVRPI